MSKKPRKNKIDPRSVSAVQESQQKKEKDWTFADIVRSKTRRR